MYYVYEWYIVSTGEVIYVGKGTGRRYKVRKHNRLFNEMIRRFECESRIVKEFDTEKDAFDYEFIRVMEMRLKGECVCNIYNGGSGGTTEWWNDELRKQYSEHNVMKSESQRKRMSEHNPMKNKAISEKTARSKSRAVVIGDKEYSSVKEARESLKVSFDAIANWCKKGINAKGEKCHYKDSPLNEFTDKRYNKGTCRSVIYKNVRYESVKDFAESIGISMSAALYWLRRGFNSDGVPCRYEDDTRELTFINRYAVRNKAKAKPVIVNGIKYDTCEDASKALGISKSTLYSYLQGTKRSRKYICEYGNQQPSQGKSDNSTLEGSTTNG